MTSESDEQPESIPVHEKSDMVCVTCRGRQGLKISTGSLLSGPNAQQAAPAPHLADLQFRAGSLLPTAIYKQAAKYQNFPNKPENLKCQSPVCSAAELLSC